MLPSEFNEKLQLYADIIVTNRKFLRSRAYYSFKDNKFGISG